MIDAYTMNHLAALGAGDQPPVARPVNPATMGDADFASWMRAGLRAHPDQYSEAEIERQVSQAVATRKARREKVEAEARAEADMVQREGPLPGMSPADPMAYPLTSSRTLPTQVKDFNAALRVWPSSIPAPIARLLTEQREATGEAAQTYIQRLILADQRARGREIPELPIEAARARGAADASGRKRIADMTPAELRAYRTEQERRAAHRRRARKLARAGESTSAEAV